MGRKKPKITTDKNKLIQAIEEGRSPTGIKGLVRVEVVGGDDFYENDWDENSLGIYIPVVIESIKMRSCGIQVFARPDMKGATGSFSISPCSFYDSLDAVHTLMKEQEEKDHIQSLYRDMMRGATVRHRRIAFQKVIANLNEENREILESEAKELKVSFETISTPMIERLGKLALKLHYVLDDDYYFNSY